MHLLYTDEVNLSPTESDFFIYAGVAIPGDQAGDLSAKIAAIREESGYKPEDTLKFNTRERPPHISPVTHADVKQQVMIAAADHGVRLFVSFILHQVATSPDEARRNEINRICYHFNCFLARERDHGFVLLDPFNDSLGQAVEHLREKFTVGLIGMPFAKKMPMSRILGYHVASIGTSHFCSLVDVVLGSLRFAVNNRSVSGRPNDVARLLIQQIAPLCIKTSQAKADEISIFFSPKTIKAAKYLDEYKKLHKFLAENGIEGAQVPKGQ